MKLSSRTTLLKEADLELKSIRNKIKPSLNEIDGPQIIGIITWLAPALAYAWSLSQNTREKINKFDSLTGLDKIGDAYFDETEFKSPWLSDLWEKIKKDLLTNQKLKLIQVELGYVTKKARGAARELFNDMEYVSDELNIPIGKLKDLDYLLQVSNKLRDPNRKRTIKIFVSDVKDSSNRLKKGFEEMESVIKDILLNSGLNDFDKMYRDNMRYTTEDEFEKNKKQYLDYLIKRAINFFQNEIKPMESNMKDNIMSKLPPEYRRTLSGWFGTFGGKRFF